MNEIGKFIGSSSDAISLALGLRELDHEELWVAFMNNANNVISMEMLGMGGLDCVTMDARAILKRALLQSATGIILFHNHPSHEPNPGKEDIAQTERLKKACDVMDVRLLDHIVVGLNYYYSFADEEVKPIKD